MFKIVFIMLGGVATGYLMRKRNLKWVTGAITVAIWLLLFLLGIAVGLNGEILNNLDTIGIQALILSVFAVTGSVVLAKVVYCRFFKKEDLPE